jgi:hypothetical protein
MSKSGTNISMYHPFFYFSTTMFEGRNQNMGITMEKRIYLAKRVRKDQSEHNHTFLFNYYSKQYNI